MIPSDFSICHSIVKLFSLTLNNKFASAFILSPFCYLEFESYVPAAKNLPRMSEQNIADLLALDTGALKSRLSELRRYL